MYEQYDKYNNRMKDRIPITIYLSSDENGELERISCLWCKRTIAEVRGSIDRVFQTPMPIKDFGVATRVQCKLCGQKYQLAVIATLQPIQG